MNPRHLFRAYLELPCPKVLVPGFSDLWVMLPDEEPVGTDLERAESILTGPDGPIGLGQLSYADFRTIAPVALEVLEGLRPKDIRAKLIAGARAPENQVQCMALGQSFDLTHLSGFTVGKDKPALVFIPRPDRFFGVPLNQLHACHYLAYYAAHEVARKRLHL